MSGTNKKSSVVWDFFDVKFLDNSVAVCRLCHNELSRGKSDNKRYSTSPLYTHLRACHGPELSRAEKEKEAAAAASLHEPPKPAERKRPANSMTLEQCIAKKQTWSADHPSSLAATKFLAEMIAVDLQPYAVVENECFRRYSNHLEPRYALPSRRMLSENIIPEMYARVKTKLKISLKKAIGVSFTTDMWTEPCTTKAFIGVSAHWIDDSWQRKFAILNCEEFGGRHTADRIAVKFQSLLDVWELTNVIHVVLRDNAANMAKAFVDANLNSIRCALHTLQLAVHDCILDQRAVSDGLAACRRLVGHFKHSAVASQRLADLQRELHCEVLRPVQDVATRWNSTYYMIERLLAIKRSISVYCTEAEHDKAISNNTWTLLQNVKHLLSPLEQLTRDLSAYDACISAVIPAILGLKLTLEADKRDVGVKTMKSGLLDALEQRFNPLLTNSYTTVATAVDPRFKLRFFPTDEVRDEVKEAVRKAALAVSRGQSYPPQAVDPALPSTSNSASTATTDERDATQSTSTYEVEPVLDVWSLLDQLAADSTMTDATAGDSNMEVKVGTEMAAFFGKPLVPRAQDPLLWWKVNEHRLPVLALLARVYMSAPPSSVQSERIFSSAGDVYNEHRTRLAADNAERLIFLKFNVPLLDHNY